jgi:SAM-dependent methyltransferase
MERSLYDQLARIEDTHWWFVYRRKLIATLIESTGGVNGQDALDLGCGTGGNTPFLRAYCKQVSGLDISDAAIALARRKYPDGDFCEGDTNMLREHYPVQSFDLISDFNVLYHGWVESDLHVIHDIAYLLRPGGMFVLTEPAFSYLRRAHDVADYGARRYTLGQLTGMLKNAGFRDVQGTYFNMPVFPIALLLAVIDRLGLSPKDTDRVLEMTMPPKWLNDMAGAVLSIELAAVKVFGRIPLGVGVACTARKS